jgi:hypothetical protein
VVAPGPQPGAGGGLVADRGELAPGPVLALALYPVTNTLVPSGLTAIEAAILSVPGGPLYRAIHSRLPEGAAAGDVLAEPATAACAAAAAAPGGTVPLAPAALSAAPATTAAIPRAMFLCTVISPCRSPRRHGPSRGAGPPVNSRIRPRRARQPGPTWLNRPQRTSRHRRCGRGISRPVRGLTSSETRRSSVGQPALMPGARDQPAPPGHHDHGGLEVQGGLPPKSEISDQASPAPRRLMIEWTAQI